MSHPEEANSGAEVETSGRESAEVMFINMASSHDNGKVLELDGRWQHDDVILPNGTGCTPK